jgi:XTP/dITP diphosphohydrolase
MSIERIYFITSNSGKADVARERLARYEVAVEQLHLELVELQSISVVDVARAKAKQALALAPGPFLIEDSGLHIDAFGGFPGALAKPTLKGLGDERLASLMKREEDRVARVESALVFGEPSTGALEAFTGVYRGTIAAAPRGQHRRGWAVERIFVPEGRTQTLAQMDDDAWRAFLDGTRQGDPYDQYGQWRQQRFSPRNAREETTPG